MRFWDASAVVPLLVQEAGTELAIEWLREDPSMVLWGLTRIELTSAIERRAREGRLSPSGRTTALEQVNRLSGVAHEVSDLVAVRTRSIPLLSRYPLRAADAAQLGAALLVSDPDPGSLSMVVLDRRLAEAADREGLRVVTWPG